ncbi:MAG: hypothetical protein Q4D62_05230 [Planctomycetia bacterium]|nr:hypothetical protein [Planctomycetia bacterium]
MKLLIVGNSEQPEFRFVLNRIPAEIFQKKIAFDYEKSELPDWIPTLVLVLQSFPGEFSSAEMDTLKTHFPISPRVVIQGSWCEGSRRTDPPPKGIHYLYWHEFHTLFPTEYAAWQKGLGTIWSQPEMGERDLWFLEEVHRPVEIPNFSPAPLTFRIQTEDYALYALLRDIFLRDAYWQKSISILPFSTTETSYDVLLFDFPDFQPATRERFSEFLLHTTPEKTVTFSEFPRVKEWLWLESLGVTALFSKPFRIRDLLRQSYPCFSLKKPNS